MDKKILYVLGDSVSLHYGPYLDRILSTTNDFKGILRLYPENTSSSSRLIELLNEDVRKFPNDIIIWNSGLHDVRRNRDTKEIFTTIEEYKNNIEKIYNILKNKGFTQIFINSTPIYEEKHNNRSTGWIRKDLDVNTYNEEAERILEGLNVPVVDLYSFTKTLGVNALFDHVHFKPEVRAEQAKYIAECITRIMQKPEFQNQNPVEE